MSNSISSSRDDPLSRIGLIGHPVRHSVSPVFQQAGFDALGLPFCYEAWDTPAADLPERIASLRDGDRIGANVTVPHKEAVIELLDHVTDEAAAVGAVNTIVRDRLRLVGHNTDIDGFLDALRIEGGFDVCGARVCIFGAGGAARAVVFALLHNGAASITLHNRTTARSEALVAELGGNDGRLTAVVGSAGGAARGSDLIINCTSLGMAGSPVADVSPLEASEVPSGVFVCDIVANPETTPLLALARENGCRTLGGLPMLVRQGAASFALWTGRDAPIDVMFQAVRRAMGHGQ
jgi:shikimate dehydrogenase